MRDLAVGVVLGVLAWAVLVVVLTEYEALRRVA